MDILLRIMLIIGICIYFIILLKLIRREQLNLKYTLVWFSLGVLLLIITIFPQIITFFSKIFGIHSDVSTAFLIIIFGILVILMQITAIISRYNLRIRKMAQKYALNEYKTRKIIDNINNK